MKKAKPSEGIESDIIWGHRAVSILNKVVRKCFSWDADMWAKLNNNKKLQWHF